MCAWATARARRTRGNGGTMPHARRARVRSCSDIGTAAGANELAARAKKEFGGLDICVQNAGIWPVEEAAASAMTDARWANTMRENVDAMFFFTRAALGAMRDDGPHRARVEHRGPARRVHARRLRGEQGRDDLLREVPGDRAGAARHHRERVAPGWVDTEMCAEPFADGGSERIAATIPVGRIATAEDIALPIVFLCSRWRGTSRARS